MKDYIELQKMIGEHEGLDVWAARAHYNGNITEEEKAGKEKVCPHCGKQKEEFAVVWGWKHCYTCSVELQGSEVK